MIINKRRIFSRKASVSFTQIFILVVAVFAFCWMISEIDKNVGGARAMDFTFKANEWSKMNDGTYDYSGSDSSFSEMTLSRGRYEQLVSDSEKYKFTPGKSVSIQDDYFYKYPDRAPESWIQKNMANGYDIGGPASATPSALPTGVSAAASAVKPTFRPFNQIEFDTSAGAKFVDNAGDVWTYQGNKGENAGAWKNPSGEIVKPTDLPTDLTLAPASKVEAAPTFWGMSPGYFWGNLLQGLQWAGLITGALMLIGSFVGEKYKGLVNALAGASFGGIMAGYLTKGILSSPSGPWGPEWASQKGWFGLTKGTAWGIGVGVVTAAIIFIMLYKSTKEKNDTKTVTFSCYPWQAPTGVGKTECEKCNTVFKTKSGITINTTCSEYQCRALGQNCNIVNKGTGNELCAYMGRDDTQAPKIIPDEKLFSPNDYFKYEPNNAVRPPAIGDYIVPKKEAGGNLQTKCLRPYTPLTFGFRTDEPAQCKISDTLKGKYEEMPAFFGDSNLFAYEHKQTMVLPGPNVTKENKELNLVLDPSRTMKLYVRCVDGWGNVNGKADSQGNVNYADAFEVQFCIDDSPDLTAPEIKGTSLINGANFAAGINSTPIEVYTNEPADCKWSKRDVKYDLMENSMSCAQDAMDIEYNQMYKCTGTLDGLISGVNKENKFYFRCKDQPWLGESTERTANQNSYELTLVGSEPLYIKSVGPSGKMFIASDKINVSLTVETTHGAKDGQALCSYSTTKEEKDYISFYYAVIAMVNTHKQELFLPEGDYQYYIKCVDMGGNVAYNETSFSIMADRTAPEVIRAVNSGGDKNLKITTDEGAKCVYNDQDNQKCDYNFDEATKMRELNDGLTHITPWVAGQTYYIKCQDLYGNEPAPTECSVIIGSREELTTDVNA